MPENQVKLIHVFMRKHIEQLVLQTSHNIILIHYKCRGLHRKQSWWGSCIHRCDETEEKHPNSRFLLAADTSFHSFIRLFISLPLPCFVQVWNPHKTTADWRLLSRVHGGGAGVMHGAHPKLSRPTNSLSPRRRQLRYHYACHCKWTTSCVCVC